MKTLIIATAALAISAGATLAQETVRLGTEGAYPPYNFINDAGEVDGYERELGDLLCERTGLTCEWVTTEWDSIIPNLVSANYDAIMAGMSITPERDEVIDFTQNYLPPVPSAYVALSEDVDVENGVIAAQTSTIQAGHVAETGATLLEFATPDETLAAVRNGEADAVLADKDYLVPFVEESGGELVFAGEDVILGGGIGMGLRESDTELKETFDAAIAELKADGTINAARGRGVRAPPLPSPMFPFCENPDALASLPWFACYLTSGTHLAFYASFGTTLVLLAVTAPVALLFGFGGAVAARSPFLPLRWFGKGYTAIVRGVPDIVFFLFFVIALDQAFEWARHQVLCPGWELPVRQGNDFVVCDAAKFPLSSAPLWLHEGYGFFLAILTFAIVFGAFAANVLFGAMRAVPRAQTETAEAFGMTPRQAFRRVLVPQMWVYALPGLSNLWMILVKATPLLFLLGVEDIVFWARELGGQKTSTYTYPHPDWRLWYFLGLLVFYLLLTKISEVALGRVARGLSRGQATVGGEALRRAETTA